MRPLLFDRRPVRPPRGASLPPQDREQRPELLEDLLGLEELHRHTGKEVPALADHGLWLETLNHPCGEAPGSLAANRQLHFDPERRLQRHRARRRNEQTAGADVAMIGREKTRRVGKAHGNDRVALDIEGRSRWRRRAGARCCGDRRSLREHRLRFFCDLGHGRDRPAPLGRRPGLAGERHERLDKFLRRQKSHADALLVDLAQSERDAVDTGDPAFGDEAAIGIDELETQSLAGHQADVAVVEESALRYVGGVRGMALRFSRAPEAQLDAPGVPAVDPSFHLVE